MSDTVTRTIIAALPDWYVCLLVEDTTCDEPIIAWEIERIEGDYAPKLQRADRWVIHNVMPITINGNMENSGNKWCIKRSDSQYEFIGDQVLDNEAEAIKKMKES